jgi:Protein of unknown function (DUF1592)/Protein of unknown function (DUF1588)/Protein of unknown function (DUF1587)/Protein of unknown function (DUF1585)/Protein of unknown function (DUF1595)/Ca-dependent carbohydrate-binding module xylan-binding
MRSMRWMHRRTWPALCLGVALASCQGQIGLRTGETPITPGEDGGAADSAVVAPLDPQRVTIHRLNRAEYNNTVRDLLGTRSRPADEFAADDRGYGFDNIADVLSVSPLHVEQYDRAAEALVDEAIGSAAPMPVRAQVECETLMGTVGQATTNAWLLWSNGEVVAPVMLPGAGRYRVTVRAWQSRAGAEDALLAIERDGVAVRTHRVAATSAAPAEYTAEFMATGAGSSNIGASFGNDFVDMATMADRNLWVDWIRVEGPLDAGTAPATRAQWITCDPAAMGEDVCARQVLTRFARRAFRRPAPEAEVNAIWTRFRGVTRMHSGTWEDAIKLSMRAMLVSPHFIYRVEIDPSLTDPAPHPLTDHELASRLSYFLWSSMPDETLDRLADGGTLHEPAVLREQVQRMLDDPRAQALTQNFAGQWLHTRNLDEHEVNATLYPSFSPMIRSGMRAETDAFFAHFLERGVSMREFLVAQYTFIDERLAGFYGVTLPAGTGVRRVDLSSTNRLGIITQGLPLTVTSHADRTSPVKRGQWVLSQLLCAPPPPPPPSVEGLPMQMVPTGSLRQRLEAHRADPVCRSCHDVMDPIGFGLENFDGTGMFRSMDGAFAIDSTGELPGGARFDGPRTLARLIQDDPRFPRCVTKQVMTYALGRGLNERDDAQLDRIVRDWTASGQELRALIERVVLSDAFRLRRAETPRS